MRGRAEITNDGELTNGRFTDISLSVPGGTIDTIDTSRPNSITGAFFGDGAEVLAGKATWGMIDSIDRNAAADIIGIPDIPSSTSSQVRVSSDGIFFLEQLPSP